MEVINFVKILSVNSETQHHEAKHLLKSEVSLDKSWQCAKGTDKGVVILKMERATAVSKIDVGNAHSAFIEILVGRASDAHDQFQPLVPTSTFMTPNESKASVNKNQVRFFTTADFDPGAVGKQWDLLKIVCSQPFDRHVPFGLCFVKVHGESSESGLVLKKTNESVIAVGSFFRKLKEEKEKAPSVSEKVREEKKSTSPEKHTAVTASKLIVKKSSKDRHKRDDDDVADNRRNRDLGLEEERSPKRSKPNSESPSRPQTPSTSGCDKNREKEKAREKAKERELLRQKEKAREEEKKKRKDRERAEADDLEKRKEKEREERRKRKEREEVEKRKVNEEKTKNTRPERKRKPFKKLLEDVNFVLSGYQNPERGNYRSHAISMGAKYFQDWEDGRCTHLIAAYINTPKCNQVKGKGKIVGADWVEKCYRDKKRYPWRRFALDKNERRQPESEEEIDLETSSPPRTPSTSGILAKTPTTTSSKVSVLGTDAKDRDSDNDSYGASTDDEDTETPPSLPDFFRGLIFYVDEHIADRRVLERYIIAYNGEISEKLDERVNFFVTFQKGSVLDLLKKTAKHLQAVSPTWVQAVNCAKKFVPATDFTID